MIMEKYSHIVQVHPVENGEPNLYKVISEREFDAKELADIHINMYNNIMTSTQAVYRGCVNNVTGELE
jgi:hypothetical protein